MRDRDDDAGGAPERTAVLVVRAWHEGEGPAGLRARITYVIDLDAGREMTASIGGRDAILAAMQRWLDEFAASRVDASGVRRRERPW